MADWPFIAKICAYVASFSMMVVGFLGFFAASGSVIVSIVESLYFVALGFLLLSAQCDLKWYKVYFGFLASAPGKAVYCTLYFSICRKI